MFKAIVISTILHISIILFIPSVNILPPESPYIEIEAIWIGKAELGEQDMEFGSENAQAQPPAEQPQLAHIPTKLDVVDPVMVTSGTEAVDWESTPLTGDSPLPETLENIETIHQFHPPEPSLISLEKPEFFPVQETPQKAPEPEVMAVLPEQSVLDVSMTAEQRYPEVIRSQSDQVPQEKIEPEFIAFKPLELMQSNRKTVMLPKTIKRTTSGELPRVTITQAVPPEELSGPDSPKVLLPLTKAFPEQSEDEITITADNSLYPLKSNISLTPVEDRRFLPAPYPFVAQSSSEIRDVSSFPGIQKRQSLISSIPEQSPTTNFLTTSKEKIHTQIEHLSQKLVLQLQEFSSIPLSVPTPEYLADHDAQKQKEEALPRPELPEVSPSVKQIQDVEPDDLRVSSYIKAVQLPQEMIVFPHKFPKKPGEKISSIEELFLPKQLIIQPEEISTQVAQPFSPKQSLYQTTSTQTSKYEPRIINIQPTRPVSEGTEYTFQAPGIQRSFTIGGETQDSLILSKRPLVGLFVPKETTQPQIKKLETMLQEDDATQRIPIEKSKTDEDAFVIQGPASERKVEYKPARLPELQIDMEVEIRLKFWVLPDGTVGEIIPLQRGDVRLERTAIEYFRSWRFTPVSPNNPKVWGIIPIKYKLQ